MKLFNPRTGLRDLAAGDSDVIEEGAWIVEDASLAEHVQESTARFLAEIHGSAGFLELRAIASHRRERIYRRFVALPMTPVGLAEVQGFAREHGRTHNIYHGVAARKTGQSGGLDNCDTLCALFVEIDFKQDRPLSDAWDAIQAFALKPSAILHSGGGLHVYWLLRDPIDLQTDRGLTRARHWLGELTNRLGGDVASAEPARVLRVPDTPNLKPEYGPKQPTVTMLRYERSVRHGVPEIIAILGDADPQLPATRIAEPEPAIQHGIDEATRIKFARAWLKQQRTAVEGEGGDRWTYQICCAVTIGHDLAEESAIAALRDWNARCLPPWSQSDLRQKVRNAIRYGKGQRGEKLVEFPWTEAGDAESFAGRYAETVRYDHRRGHWLLAGTDGIWESDKVEFLNILSIRLMRERQQRAMLIPDSDRRVKSLKWATNGESLHRINDMLRLAKAMPPIADNGDAWDGNASLLGVANGVVDLYTGELRAARLEERVTMRCGAAYDPDARSVMWEQALQDIFPHRGLIEFVQTILGYSATGETRHDKWMLSTGGGRNGKGTVYGAVRAALGDYALELPASVFDMRRNQEWDLAKLPGKRFVTSSESGDTLHLNHDRIKQLSGGDPLRAADKYEKSFEFSPSCKLWLACNKKPRVTDDTLAFWARVIIIPFTASFLGNEDFDLRPTLEKDPGHRRAVLSWIVVGARRYYDQGGFGPLPKVVQDAVDDYRHESEPLAPFYDACCVIGQGHKVQALALFRAYQRWAEGDRRALNMKTFGQEVRKRFEAEEKRHTFYLGVALREDRLTDPESGSQM